jgi:hypothetical protein
MILDEAITLFLDVAGSAPTSIDLNEIFATEANDFTLVMPYALQVVWRR